MNREQEPVKCAVCGKEGELDCIQHPVSGAKVCLACAASMGQINDEHRKRHQEMIRRESEMIMALRLALISAYVTAELMRLGRSALPSATLAEAEQFANAALQIQIESKVH